METSPFWDEIRAEQVHAMALQLGRQKFGKAPTRKQQAQLAALTELDQLEKLALRILRVDSWANLLNGHAAF